MLACLLVCLLWAQSKQASKQASITEFAKAASPRQRHQVEAEAVKRLPPNTSPGMKILISARTKRVRRLKKSYLPAKTRVAHRRGIDPGLFRALLPPSNTPAKFP